MEISSKLSLYEFLTMLVVGGIFIEMLGMEIPSAEGEMNWFVYSVLSFTMGLVFHRFIECLLSLVRVAIEKRGVRHLFYLVFCRNSSAAIKDAKNEVSEQTKSASLIHEYYNAYYEIMDNPIYKTIERLEAQEAFYRDLFVLLIVNAMLLVLKQNYDAGFFHWIFGKEYLCKEWVSFVVFGLLLIAVIGFTKKKIYELVWSSHQCSWKNTDNKNDK